MVRRPFFSFTLFPGNGCDSREASAPIRLPHALFRSFPGGLFYVERGKNFSRRIVSLDEVGPIARMISIYQRHAQVVATYLENSYADQQMAVLGMVVTTRGRTPLKKPRKPARLYNNRQPPTKLFTLLTSGSVEVPRV